MRLEADEAHWFDLPTVDRVKWPVILVHHDHEMLVDFDDDGMPPGSLEALCDEPSRRILVNASMTTPQIHEATHHEAIHAVLWDRLPSHLLKSKVAEGVEEIVIREVSPILCRVARPRWPAFPPEALAVIRAARRRRRRAA